MDFAFLKALQQIQGNDDVCILRKADSLIICREPVAIYDTMTDIRSDEFVTGWQNYDGQTGTWVLWNQIDEISDIQTTLPETDSDEIARVLLKYKKQEGSWKSSLSEAEFINTVSKMKLDMEHGEYFLANLTRNITNSFEFDAKQVAKFSCLLHDTPYRFFMQINGKAILGLSPERFVQINKGVVSCEPMKGTSASEINLKASSKEHVENTMMIDLVRSDLSRICDPTTIRLQDRGKITKHPGLFQMSSTIQASLKADLPITNAIKEIMPVASVTGTPKPYVLEKIKQYEPQDRGTYCGVYGWIDDRLDKCDLAVAIRTIQMSSPAVKIGVGAGITLDSESKSEFEETELKASRLTNLVELAHVSSTQSVFTSLRINQLKQCFRLQDHIDRLVRHAQIVGIETTFDQVAQFVSNFLKATSVKENSYLKIRISKDGDISAHIEDFEPETKPLTIGIAPSLICVKDEMPKFQNRLPYEVAFEIAKSLATEQITDAILIANDNATETTRANFFVLIDNQVITPPLSGAMLAGVARQSVIEHLNRQKIQVVQRDLTLSDIELSNEMICTNSVRGIVRVGMISSKWLKSDKKFSSDSDQLYKQAHMAFEPNDIL